MRKIVGESGRVLEVDLSRRQAEILPITTDDRQLYLGGKGLALKYLAERLRCGIDPLSEANILAIMTGIVVGSGAPCSARFSAATKSPLTGLIASSSCGGPFGTALKTAGYEGIIIRGTLTNPGILVVDAEGAHFEGADDLWGRDTREAQERLGLGKKDGTLVIGPAGENGVWFANIASGHRFFGRAGFGAVMGSKKLKAVVVRGGSYGIVAEHPDAFKKVCSTAKRYINRNRFTGELYRRFGTASHVDLCNAGGIFPVKNFQDGTHKDALNLSGQVMQSRYHGKHRTCRPCTILCGHSGSFPDGVERQIPEYETVGLLGANLGVFDPDVVATWNEACGRWGIDTMSCGATLAYVMEAGERGLLETNLRFGTPQGVTEAIESIALRRGFGDEMAHGTRWLARKYGGADCAMHVKGLEVAAYDPRGCWGQGLAYAVANRGGCHLSATLFPLEAFLNLLDPRTVRAKARFVCFFESLCAVINSLPTCLFTTYAYLLEPPIARLTPKRILGWTMQNLPAVAVKLMDVRILSRLFAAITGIPMSQRRLLQAGDRIVILERYLNTLEGVSRKDDTLPERFLSQIRPSDSEETGVPLEPMLDDYYSLRGYNRNGIPTRRTLKRFQIPLRADEEPEVIPGRKAVKTFVVKMVFFVLGRALQSASRIDSRFREELDLWPEGYSILFKVLPFGPRMGLALDPKRHLRYKGDTLSERRADLILCFKNIESAYMLLTAQLGTAEAFAQRRINIVGDLSMAMSVTRLLNRIQAFLYPRRIAGKLTKRVPAIPVHERLWKRAWLYGLGIPLGM